MENVLNAIQLKAELDQLRPLNAEQEGRVMQKFRLDWNFHSNNIEGNSLTYGETKALLLFNITAQGKPLKDHIEITGHNEAINWVMDIVKGEEPLTGNFIRQIHTLLLKEDYQIKAQTADGLPTMRWIRVGQYKTAPNHVLTSTGEVFYFATPEETPAKMDDLLAWYKEQTEKKEIDPIFLATEFHYRFIRIHPFDDGNGRTARILMNFVLMKYGYPPIIIKTEDKENYYSVLQQADAGLIEPFVDYLAKNLCESLELMIKAANGDIENMDDIDKELSLIKKVLFSKSKKINNRRSFDSISVVYAQSILSLISQIEPIFNKFKDIYSNNSFELQILSENSNYYSYALNKENEERLFIPVVTIHDDTVSIKLVLKTRAIKTIQHAQHGFDFFIEFVFHEMYYEYQTMGIIKSERISYEDFLTYNQISELCDDYSKTHLALLKNITDLK